MIMMIIIMMMMMMMMHQRGSLLKTGLVVWVEMGRRYRGRRGR